MFSIVAFPVLTTENQEVCFLEPTALVLSYKQMFLGLGVTQRTVLLLPGSYSRFKSAASHSGHPWGLHTFYCFLTAASKWILCGRLTISAAHLGAAWLGAASDHGCASREKYVKHKIKQALLSSLRVQLGFYKVDLRWCKHLQQLERGCFFYSSEENTAVTQPWKFHLPCTGCVEIIGEYSQYCS